jgi:type III secretion system low calcium response chaperone LcrH/SycD
MKENADAPEIELTPEQMEAAAKEALVNFGVEFPPETEEQKEFEELTADLMKHLADGGTMADMFQFSLQDLEGIYHIGHTFYENGKYEKAENIFAFLGLYDHIEDKWWKSLGAARMMQKKYEDAAKSYAMAAILNMEDPEIQYYAGYCLSACGKTEQAVISLECAIELANEKNEDEVELKRKAEKLIEILKTRKGE